MKKPSRKPHRIRVRAAQEVARLARHAKRFDPARRLKMKREAIRKALVRRTMTSLANRSRSLNRRGWDELSKVLPEAVEAALGMRRSLRAVRRMGALVG
jgi:hypothetical protein